MSGCSRISRVEAVSFTHELVSYSNDTFNITGCHGEAIINILNCFLHSRNDSALHTLSSGNGFIANVYLDQTFYLIANEAYTVELHEAYPDLMCISMSL